MKTATSPQPQFKLDRAQLGRSVLPSLAALSAAAALTIGIGLSMPLIAGAQEQPQRTIATGSGIPLSADAPDRYTVKKGDTLWDIAQVFLRDPWYWPEIWYVNPQVKNPHLIYPGDTLALVSLEGRPQVSIAERGPEGAAADADAGPATGPTRSGTGTRLSPHIRSEPITSAVTAVPYNNVAVFMRRPTLLSKEEVKSGPYIVAIRDSRVAAGEDNDFYAQGLEQAIDGSRYNIVHVGEALRDPETNKVLGYRGRYIGAGTVTGAGQVAKLRAGMTEVEALRGDKLFAEDITVATDFIPHPVAEDFHGTILGVDGVYATGKYGVVAVNRGAKDGMEPGHVLAIKQKGDTVPDHFANGGQASYWSYGRKVKLPDERIGVVMLFKVHEQLSYGLVMDTTHPVRVGDLVATP